MTLKAIETRYKGYRFRSRLEARWAVFFDVLRIRYEYEKQGYEFGERERYLPDFWLPDLRLWYEIKGEYVYAELDRLLRFKESQEWPLACAIGSIGDHWIRFYAWDLTNSSGGSYETDDAEWCFSNGIFTLDAKPGKSDRMFLSDNLMGETMPWFSYAYEFGSSRERVDAAIAIARSARFEHGEHGL